MLIALVVVIVGALVVLLACWLIGSSLGRDFVERYPGETALPDDAPVGLPAWLGWQHFLNAFFLVLIIRTGWQVRTQKRPPATWVRRSGGAAVNGRSPRPISITLWAHLALDLLWLVNGVVFVAVLFVSGQWMRVVPTSAEIVPNALSAALQYLSLQWPTENGWVNYNSLQVIAYFITIFVAAPLAIVSGVRMSGLWPSAATRLNRAYPIEWARRIHLPVMLYFVAFTAVHVVLVLATGMLRNLNHLYAAADSTGWIGFWMFVASIVLTVGAVLALRPAVLILVARLFGTVGR